MYWKSSHSKHQHELYELWSGEKKLLSLEYHPFTNSARIEYEDTRRVFLLRKEGFLRNKTVLRNEYGVRIGQLNIDRNRSEEGSIDLHEKKFSFRLNNNPTAELVLRSDESGGIEFVCGLNPDNRPDVKISKFAAAEQFLLMALCWYLLLPMANKETAIALA